MENLQRLADSNLGEVDVETLAEGVRSAELAFERSPEWSGRMIAELKNRMSWKQLSDMLGLPQTTLYRRAQPYLSPPAPTED